jgi:hypothetical protein
MVLEYGRVACISTGDGLESGRVESRWNAVAMVQTHKTLAHGCHRGLKLRERMGARIKNT